MLHFLAKYNIIKEKTVSQTAIIMSLKGSIKVKYSIKNEKTQNVLYESDSMRATQYIWRHIPKRKCSRLLMVNNETGEVIKIKEMKGVPNA
jgi:hypothetical protein